MTRFINNIFNKKSKTNNAAAQQFRSLEFIESEIISILAKEHLITQDIDEDAKLCDNGVDSYEISSFICELEVTFKIKLQKNDEDDISTKLTIHEIAALVYNKIRQKVAEQQNLPNTIINRKTNSTQKG